MLRFYDNGEVSPQEEIVNKFNSSRLIWVYDGDGMIKAMPVSVADKIYKRYAWSYLDENELEMLKRLDLEEPIRREE